MNHDSKEIPTAIHTQVLGVKEQVGAIDAAALGPFLK